MFENISRKKKAAFVFIIATFMGLFSASIRITAELAERFHELEPSDFWRIIYPIVDELTGVYSFWLLVPALIVFYQKFPINKNNLYSRIFLYILVSIVVGLTHTSMMYISRSIIYPILNLGSYDYGYIPYRIVMEYLKQFMSFWAVYIIYLIIRLSREREEQNLRNTQLEEQLTKSRLETLKMQLNPHFLFNTLNMISSTMYDNLEAADKMIANLSDLLRITLKTSGKGESKLLNEIEILKLYIDIMKARFNDKLEVLIKVDDHVKNALVPNFLFQPLVENSIKHGMENLSRTCIDISAEKEGNNLYMVVKDNGPGIKGPYKEVLQRGVGLSNTVERLEKLYGDKYDFNWQNLENGFSIHISIPFKERID